MTIIGGKFGLPKDFAFTHETPPFLTGSPVLLFNGRSGIKIIVDVLQPSTIWMPSYLCPTMLTPIDQSFAQLKFYPIDADLQCVSNKFISRIKPGDLFVFIDYFGFPFNRDLINELRTLSVITFQDCCQALFFDHRQSPADFCLYSPRKFLGVPDGGILHIKSDIHIDIPVLNKPPDDILFNMLCAVIKRREFDLYGGDREWNEYFHRGEDELIPSYTKMSELSLLLLKQAFNFQKIVEKRRNNYIILLERLKVFSIFDRLPDDVVPLGFPIKIKIRDCIQNNLFKHQIYPPIHWDISEAVPRTFTASHQLSEEILTLPCDQRYDEKDMIKMADNVIILAY